MTVFQNRALQIAIGILAAYAVCYSIIPYERFKLYLDAGRVGIWGVVFAITFPVAFRSVFAKKRTQGGIVSIALHLTALIILIQAIWIPINRELGHMFWSWVSPVVSTLVVLGYICAGAFFLLPIGNTIGVTPPRNWWFLLWAGIVGALAAGVMIGLGLQSFPM